MIAEAAIWTGGGMIVLAAFFMDFRVGLVCLGTALVIVGVAKAMGE